MIKKLYEYIKPYSKYLLYCFLLVSTEVVCEMMMPLLMSKIIDIGIPNKNIGFIAGIGVLMVLLAVISIALGVANMKFSALASQGFAANLRESLFNKIKAFSFSNIDKFSTGSLVTRLTSDVTQLQVTVMMMLRMLLRAPLMLISAMIFAISINTQLSSIIFAAIPILIFGILLVIRTAEHLYTTTQRRIDSLNSDIQENLIAIRVVKAFVREAYEKLKFSKVNNALTEASLKAGNLISLVMPLMLLVMNSAMLAVIWFGGHKVGTGVMGTGAFVSFISYLMQILFSVMMFSFIFILFARSEACGKRIVEVIETNIDIEDSENAKDLPIKNGKIEFCHVDFKYVAGGEGKNVLSDINFVIEPGEFAAIVGGTGSGKTTLVNLIPRLYDTTSGEVLVDGVNVRDYKLETLRHSIGMVLQKNVLFSGTIRENLLWGNENAKQSDLEKSASDAQAHDFITSLPEGYDTELGQGGVNVSGGQKQRLCIARAMAKKPPILILDDSTSAVDTATEAKLRKAFRENLRGTTVLIIAQRISSVKDADKIIVLDDGKICGIGTHEELLKNNEVYKEICLSQQEGMVS
ncbi:MAG: ABC transporter ATP-binding protein/permease [Clostridiales bacterium]|nr:ABC transporter ATP-binding protein/permease [Clostridiales bacterium]